MSKSAPVYRRLFAYLREDWKTFLLSIVAMSIAASTEPLFARLMKPMIDGGFVERDPTAMLWTPLAIVGLFFLRGAASYVNDTTTTKLAGGLVLKLRAQMFDKMMRLPVPFYDDHASGRVISRVTNDVNQVTDAGFSVITVVVKDGLTILGLLGLLFWTDWQLTLICFVMIPIVAISLRWVSRKLRTLTRENQQRVGEMTQVLGETVDCQRVIKVYGGQNREKSRFFAAADSLRKNQIYQASVSSLNTGVTQLLVSVALAVIIYLASLRAQMGSFTAGDFMSFLAAMIMLFAPLKRITGVNQSLQRGLAAADSVFGFLDVAEEPNPGGQKLAHVAGNLRFENVSLTYPTSAKPALNGVSFSVKAGETVALVGGSGSGKSSLIHLIPRFYLPNLGEIYLDDVPLSELELTDLRRHIALVSQDIALFNDTIAANIAYACEPMPDLEALRAAAKAAHALEFIEALPEGFDTMVGEKGLKLSGGQRQRLAIARAILKNAPILLLDEATSALDSQSEHHVQAALDELMRGRTTLVVAHRLSTIEHADRILVMDAGNIVESGNHAELLAQNGVYARLHALQFKGQQPF